MTDELDPRQVTNIDVDKSAFVRLTFADDMIAEFPIVALRLACPCADCNANRQRGRSVSVLAESKPDDLVNSQGIFGDACTAPDGELLRICSPN